MVSNSYLIEFRFSCDAKKAIKEVKKGIKKNFGVTRRKIVPHISLVGPVYTNDQKRLVKEIKDVCKQYALVKFKLTNFDNFEDRVIFVKIKPSEELKKLRIEMAQRLQTFCTLSELDYDDKFTFHATLVLKDIQRKFDRIWKYLQTWKLEMEQHVLRITILKNKRILAEYDLLLKKMLTRSQALDPKIFKETLKKLEKKREKSEIKFENVTKRGKICVFSDTHFDHENIITKFVYRPFRNTRHMNETMKKNWNNAVNENGTMFYLGDMSYSKYRRSIDFWLGKLNGEIFYIRGNHDSDIITGATVLPNRYGIKYKDYKFLLMHDPHRPFGYEDWIIHGDKHNNDLKKYPFINQKNKTVNVCAELVNYSPITLDKLILLIETRRSYKTIDG